MEKAGQKRKRGQDSSSGPRIDPTYGQRSFIPGLDGSNSDDEESIEALAYLRSVRSEASGIPSLLTAHKTVEDASGNPNTNEEPRGFYSDGAYVAYEDCDDDPTDEGLNHDGERSSQSYSGKLVDPSVAYHSSLINRFEAFRSHLSLLPTSPPIGATGGDYPPPFFDTERDEHEEGKRWYADLTTKLPNTTQLAANDQDAILHVLACIPDMMRRPLWTAESGTKGSYMSAWIWGLLARLAELDTLSSEEVSIVRELGKRAGSMVVGLDKAPVMNRHDDTPRGREIKRSRPPGHRRNSSSSVEADEEASSSSTPSVIEATDEAEQIVNGDEVCSDNENLTAALDMILTIVGEKYGQRDLLEARNRLWT